MASYFVLMLHVGFILCLHFTFGLHILPPFHIWASYFASCSHLGFIFCFEGRLSEVVEGLDKSITLDEVKKVCESQGNGKACGTDGIYSEVIKYGGENVWYVVWELCNSCFEEEDTPKEWLEGIMFPLYKKGDKRNPYNYRGITLLCVVSKIYNSTINNIYTYISSYNNNTI